MYIVQQPQYLSADGFRPDKSPTSARKYPQNDHFHTQTFINRGRRV